MFGEEVDCLVVNQRICQNLSGIDLLQQLESVKDFKFGKHPSNKKRKQTSGELNWTKKSIFFELPYWETLKF